MEHLKRKGEKLAKKKSAKKDLAVIKIERSIDIGKQYDIILGNGDLVPWVAYVKTNDVAPITANNKTTTQTNHMQFFVLLPDKVRERTVYFFHPFNPVTFTFEGYGILNDIKANDKYMPLFLTQRIDLETGVKYYAYEVGIGIVGKEFPFIFRNLEMKYSKSVYRRIIQAPMKSIFFPSLVKDKNSDYLHFVDPDIRSFLK